MTEPRKTVDVAAAQQLFGRALDEHDQKFGSFFLARLLGFELAYADDRCEVTFVPHDFMFNPQGSLHGGIIATAMDVSMGHLLNHLQSRGTTLEMKTQYVRAVTKGPVKAVGSVIRRGNSICFLESRLYDGEGRLAAFATSTWKVLAP
ncbi:MAG: PaaI family thioesterase [Burkholderiaceae bacterium]